jgi:two-component system, OmpR family, sensor kinase
VHATVTGSQLAFHECESDGKVTGTVDGKNQVRALATLERLLELAPTSLPEVLTQACDLVAEALNADKVDAFVHDPARATLVATGSSSQPLSELERRVGLDVLPLANGGRSAQVFKTGATFVSGKVDEDPEELRGIKHELGIRSTIGVALEVGGERRGVLMVTSLKPDFYDQADGRFAESVARWIGAVAHRAELLERVERNARQQGRRAAAEELVTILAHDLRNLIAPVQNRLEIIQLRAKSEARPREERDAGHALVTLRRVIRLVSDILDVARLDQGIFQLNRDPVDLPALAREVASVLATSTHEVMVLPSPEIVVLADRERLRQSIENVVANAIAHSPPERPVRVVPMLAGREERIWGRLRVEDAGPGIAPELLPHIFDRFATGARSTGLGLGLFLARELVLGMGGDLRAESPPGLGARMIFDLPLESAQDAAAQPARRA